MDHRADRQPHHQGYDHSIGEGDFFGKHVGAAFRDIANWYRFHFEISGFGLLHLSESNAGGINRKRI